MCHQISMHPPHRHWRWGFAGRRELSQFSSFCDAPWQATYTPQRQGPETTAFKTAFLHWARAVSSAADAGALKRRRQGDAAQRLPEWEITQAQARTLIPSDGTTIWRDVTRQGWCAFPAHHHRISARWSAHGGEQPALKALLRTIWTMHLESRGRGPEDCPIEGFFPRAVPAGSALSNSSARAAATSAARLL